MRLWVKVPKSWSLPFPTLPLDSRQRLPPQSLGGGGNDGSFWLRAYRGRFRVSDNFVKCIRDDGVEAFFDTLSRERG